MAETYVLNAYLRRLRLSEHTAKLALSIVEREQARPQVIDYPDLRPRPFISAAHPPVKIGWDIS